MPERGLEDQFPKTPGCYLAAPWLRLQVVHQSFQKKEKALEDATKAALIGAVGRMEATVAHVVQLVHQKGTAWDWVESAMPKSNRFGPYLAANPIDFWFPKVLTAMTG